MQGEDLEIRQLNLTDPRIAEQLNRLLQDAGLRLDDGIEYFAGMYDADDVLVGCGGIDGNIIKCLAVADATRGSGVSAMLISHLVNEVLDAGNEYVRVFTKPEYKSLFKSLGFYVCGESPAAVLLESDNRPLKRYCEYLSQHQADGVIVANADPITLGHLYLISEAASQCSKLAVIAVGQHPKNTFMYAERIAMLRKATVHLPNVEVLEGSEYIISQFSFPSYFIKRADDISRTQAELDLDIFCRHIAPALGCKKRFVGTEPLDALTAQYNAAMKDLLPQSRIEVVEIERMEQEKFPVSASRVRKALSGNRLNDALSLVPESDTPYLLALLAVKALRKELNLAPKPGLVDPHDNGSHSDMDYALMSQSIDSLREFFTAIAVYAFESESVSYETLSSLGIEAEKRMMAATGGVNTHRGAIFSMGLAVASAARMLSGKSSNSLRDEIAFLASLFPTPADDSHGQTVKRKYGKTGALDNAVSGYATLFDSWLPYYRQTEKTESDSLRLLMKIISELDDSNAIYRAGVEKAEEARGKAARLAKDGCDPISLKKLNEEFKRDNISHGGAADMLALTFFIDSIFNSIDTLNLKTI